MSLSKAVSNEIFAGLVSPGQGCGVFGNLSLCVITAESEIADQPVIDIMEENPDNLQGVITVLLLFEGANTDKKARMFGIFGYKRFI